jgi:hypothetical protein
VPAQGEASVTTGRRPPLDARHKASAVVRAAARAASGYPLLAKAIPQQRPSMPSGRRTENPAHRSTSSIARAGGRMSSPGWEPTMRVRQLGK